MNLKPLGDRVILKQDEAEVTTASGLFLASDAKEKPQTGTIIAVGEGKMDRTASCFLCLLRSATRSSTASSAALR